MTTNDTAAQIAALQARLDDIDAQLKYVFQQFGTKWEGIKRDRAAAMKLQGTAAPFDPGTFVYRPKPHEEVKE
jgi:hypothetical protein